MQAILMSKQVNHVNNGPDVLHGNWTSFCMESVLKYNSFVNLIWKHSSAGCTYNAEQVIKK